MKIASFIAGVNFQQDRIATSVVIESSFSKELRIVFRKGQIMKEHQTPFPIVVHILEGEIDFGVAGEVHTLPKGGIISLQGNVPHDLSAREDSVVRLTLSKLDKAERVAGVAESSSE